MYLVNQRWHHTTCLQLPCYDVGCYPCYWGLQYQDFGEKTFFVRSVAQTWLIEYNKGALLCNRQH